MVILLGIQFQILVAVLICMILKAIELDMFLAVEIRNLIPIYYLIILLNKDKSYGY